jgi:hypothetical protein
MSLQKKIVKSVKKKEDENSWNVPNVIIERKIIPELGGSWLYENVSGNYLEIVQFQPYVVLVLVLKSKEVGNEKEATFLEKSFIRICEELEISIEDGIKILNNDEMALGEKVYDDIFGEIEKVTWPQGNFENPPNLDELSEKMQKEISFEISGKYIRSALSEKNAKYFIFDEDQSYKLIPVEYKSKRENNMIFLTVDDEEIARRGRKILYNRLLFDNYILGDFPWYEIKISKWSDAVDVLLSINSKNYEEIGSKHGMLIFSSRQSGFSPLDYVFRYFIDSFESEKSDIDVLLEAGVFIKFSGHKSLVRRIDKLKIIPGFFVILTEEMAKRASNQELLTLETVKEACPDIVVGFGTLSEYKAMSLAELISSFRDSPSDPGYYIPYDQSKSFTDIEIRKLKSLLNFFRNPDVKILFDKIDNVEKNKMLFSRRITKFKNFLGNSNKEIVEKVDHLLGAIFQAGMYMRQWRGKGHDFPKKDSETRSMSKNGDFTFHIHVSNCLKLCLDLISEIDYKYLKKLPVFIFSGNRYEKYNYQLYAFLLNLANDNFCIRMASLPMISTAIYYNEMFKFCDIPIIDLSEYDSIF